MSIESKVNISAPVAFQSWSGQQLSATLTDVTFTVATDSSAHEQFYCTIKIAVAPDTMQRIYAQQWFHLNGHVMAQSAHFETVGDIELVMALSPSVSAQLGRQQGDADAVLKALVETTDSTPKLNTAELWFITEATQIIDLPEQLNEHGQLKIGFFTSWKQEILQLPIKKESHQSLSTSANSASLAQQVEEQLKKRQLAYKWHNEQIIVMHVAGKQDSNWTELIRIEQEAKLIIFYAVFPVAIPAQLRKEVAEVFMNDNYDLMNGAFEMDSSDGELRFRSSMLCAEDLHESVFDQLLADHEQIMEHYIPVLRELLDA